LKRLRHHISSSSLGSENCLELLEPKIAKEKSQNELTNNVKEMLRLGCSVSKLKRMTAELLESKPGCMERTSCDSNDIEELSSLQESSKSLLGLENHLKVASEKRKALDLDRTTPARSLKTQFDRRVVALKKPFVLVSRAETETGDNTVLQDETVSLFRTAKKCKMKKCDNI